MITIPNTSAQEVSHVADAISSDGIVHFEGAISSEEFVALTDRYCRDAVDWSVGGDLAGWSRPSLADDPTIVIARPFPDGEALPIHSEAHFSPVWPRYCWFYNSHRADDGGAETLLLDGKKVYELLGESRLAVLREGIRYEFAMMEATWNDVFGTADRDAIRTRFADQNIPCDFGRADNGDYVGYVYVSPAVFDDNATFVSSAVWARGAARAAESSGLGGGSVRLGRGTEIPDDVWQVLEDSEKLSFQCPWREGEVVLIDNHRVMHGRTAGIAPERLLVARFMQSWSSV